MDRTKPVRIAALAASAVVTKALFGGALAERSKDVWVTAMIGSAYFGVPPLPQ